MDSNIIETYTYTALEKAKTILKASYSSSNLVWIDKQTIDMRIKDEILQQSSTTLTTAIPVNNGFIQEAFTNLVYYLLLETYEKNKPVNSTEIQSYLKIIEKIIEWIVHITTG